MAFSISDFSAQFKKDFARQYQFVLDFAEQLPSFRELNVYVESTELPSREVEAIETGFLGQDIKLAGRVKYPDWTCTFRIDSDYLIYEALRNWQEKIDFNNLNLQDSRNYKGQIRLDQIDGNNNFVGGVILYGAFPKTLGSIKYDTKSSDLVTCEVVFSYDYHKWESNKQQIKGE